jgi:hypothetical protein
MEVSGTAVIGPRELHNASEVKVWSLYGAGRVEEQISSGFKPLAHC